jgi:RyR domain/Tetratricopeptide Repeats-Sensor
MPNQPQDQTRRYRPEVLTARLGNVLLGAELTALEGVWRAQASAGVIFYCARVLEAVCSAALDQAARETIHNVFAGLSRLEDLGLLRSPQSTFFHALRRLGNEVRHLHREVDARDAEVSLALLDRVLDWHFVNGEHGPRLASIRTEEEEAEPIKTYEGLRYLEQGRHEDLSRLWGEDPDLLLVNPILVGLWADALISLGPEQRGLARQVIGRGLERFPQALRLRQLDAWAARLDGDLQGSLDTLRALVAEYPNDLETLCLLAGTHKRAWSSPETGSKARTKHLKQARTLYLRAWRASCYAHAYSGINAATLHLLGGDAAGASRIGGEVEALLANRKRRLDSYWDRVTLAEALLVQGRFAAAREGYRRAFQDHSERSEWLASSRYQLELILPRLGVQLDPQAFLAIPDVDLGERTPIRLGVVVDGRLSVSSALQAVLRNDSTLGRLLQSRSPVSLRSSLSGVPLQSVCAELLSWSAVRLEVLAPQDLEEWVLAQPAADRTLLSDLLARASQVIQGADYALELDRRPKSLEEHYDALLIVEGEGSGDRAAALREAARQAGLPTCVVRLVGEEVWETEEANAHRLSLHLARVDDAEAYTPRPLDTDSVELPDALGGLVEALSEHIHDTWATQRLAEGWRYGPRRDDELRQHPCLVSYAELTEEERHYDRLTVTQTLKAILTQGFRITGPEE